MDDTANMRGGGVGGNTREMKKFLQMLTRQREPWELTPGARMSLIFASAWRVHAQALPFSYFQVFIAPCVENSLPNCTRNTLQILTISLEIHLFLKAQKMRLGPIYSSTTESHSDQMSQRSQVSGIGSQKCSAAAVVRWNLKVWPTFWF